MITAAGVAAIEVFESSERRNVQQFCYATYDNPDAPPSQYIDYFLIIIIHHSGNISNSTISVPAW